MQKQAQGLSSYREGAGQAESDPTIRKVFAMDLEKVSANLDGMGASSRAGESIQVVFEHAGTDTIYASKAFCVLTYTQKLELRKLVRRTGGVKSVLPPSQQLAGDVACCGKRLKPDGTTPLPKGSGGTRVMTGQRNTLQDIWAIRSVTTLPALW